MCDKFVYEIFSCNELWHYRSGRSRHNKMKLFHCICGQQLFFENDQCLACGRRVGYSTETASLEVLEPHGDNRWLSLGPDAAGRLFLYCENGAINNACNWLVPVESDVARCRACRLNTTIPNLAIERNRRHWMLLESGKRRLIYTLIRLDLPIGDERSDDGVSPLRFEFLEDRQRNPDVVPEFVLTGYINGKITLNVAEADSVYREQMRAAMGEPYRTVLGHFRHESGHYYWDRLVKNSPIIESFREKFGDERRDYAASLREYYAQRPSDVWQSTHISAYARAHPLEDFAECWAPMLQMVDTLETAAAQGILQAPPLRGNFDDFVNTWIHLTVVHNELNRSMGRRDAYPFMLSKVVIEKLKFIREVICSSNRPT